ncbi:hypothetical protein JNW88_00275 [Micromonospora sp. ATA32]|nr:hypothetical protein [Micromonospora sp. ATA32]
MITIPTGDLVGVLADVIPFAFPEDDLPHVNCVRLEWDGEMLHAEATDTLHAARSSWHPDDDRDGNTSQATLTNPLGAPTTGGRSSSRTPTRRRSSRTTSCPPRSPAAR